VGAEVGDFEKGEASRKLKSPTAPRLLRQVADGVYRNMPACLPACLPARREFGDGKRSFL
jgi:hypothetical protein